MTKTPVLAMVGLSLQLAAGFAEADDADSDLEELRRIRERQRILIAASPDSPRSFEIKAMDASIILGKLGRNLTISDPNGIQKATQPYVAFFSNQSSSTLRVVVHFARSDSKDLSSTEGSFAPGQITQLILGTCSGLKAYIVEVYLPGQPVPLVSTDLLFPDLSSEASCADFSGITG